MEREFDSWYSDTINAKLGPTRMILYLKVRESNADIATAAMTAEDVDELVEKLTELRKEMQDSAL